MSKENEFDWKYLTTDGIRERDELTAEHEIVHEEYKREFTKWFKEYKDDKDRMPSMGRTN